MRPKSSLVTSKSSSFTLLLLFALLIVGAMSLASILTYSEPLAVHSKHPHRSAIAKGDATRKIDGMPIYFERNDGQTDPRVKFLSHSGRYSLFLTEDSTVISLIGGEVRKGPEIATFNPHSLGTTDGLVESAVRIRMVDANPHPVISGMDQLAGRVNYLIGNDPTKFHRNVPTFGRVKLSAVYPGVDVVYYGAGGVLEYDIIAAPGADTSKIKFAVEGPAETAIDSAGNLEIKTAAGVVMMRKPVVYQPAQDGSRITVASSLELANDAVIKAGVRTRQVAVRLASYDHSRPIVIDPPIVAYSTYLGGDASSQGQVNLEQFSGITGNTPLVVADVGLDVALDPSNNAYVTGVAYSNDFPTANAYQTSQNGFGQPPVQNPTTFISKFDYSQSGSASLVYSTYLGGSGDTNISDAGHGNGDLAFGIAVDSSGQAYIVGQTYSKDFPGTSSCGSFGSSNDQLKTDVNVGFIAKLNSSGDGLVYSCYIDGRDNATESRVALYPAGCGGTSCKAYISGSTQSDGSTGFPVTSGAFQSTLNTTNGKSNATFVVVHEDGQSLDYATLYGGSGNGTNGDAGIAVAVDSSGNGYITGATYSSNLTTKNPAIANYAGGGNGTSNAFIAEFAPSQTGVHSLVYATYLGGNGSVGTISLLGSPLLSLGFGDVGTGITVDNSGNIWVTGPTASTDFPVPGTNDNYFYGSNYANIDSGAPASTGFVTELDTSQSGSQQIIYSTYFGGGGTYLQPPSPASGQIGFGDIPTDIQVADGKVYISGATASGAVSNGFPLSSNVSSCSELNLNHSVGIPISFTAGSQTYTAHIPVTGFAAELDPTQSGSNELLFSTLLGGSGTADATLGIRVDSNSDMVVAGLTYSTNFPLTQSGYQLVNNASAASGTNAFLTVLDPAGDTCPSAVVTPSPTATPTRTPTATPTRTPKPTPTPKPKRTPSPATFDLSKTDVSFPPTFVGKSKRQVVIIHNAGQSQMTGTVGSLSAPFSVSPAGSYTLMGKSKLKVVIVFIPSSTTQETAQLAITSSDPNHPSATVNISGTGKEKKPKK